MDRSLRHLLFITLLLVAANCAFGAITVSTTETWDGGQMHGITPAGTGSQADPYIYAVPDGLNLTGTGVIRTSDEYVIFNFSSGTGGLDIAPGGYFDITGSSRLSDPGAITIVLGANNLTGTRDFKTVDISKDSKDVSIVGSGSVDANSIYARVKDARAGDVTINIDGSVNVGSIDTQDQADGGNDAGSVVVRGHDVTVGSIDTRAMRTSSSTAFSGTALIEALGPSGINSPGNTVDCTGTIDTNAPAGIDGAAVVRGVVATLQSGFDADTGDESFDIHAGIVQHGLAAGDLFIDNSGGGFSAEHDVQWGTSVSFENAQSDDFETTDSVRIDVVLNEPVVSTVTVEYAVTGGTADGNSIDYSISPSPLVFAPGDTNESIVLSIVNDGADEDDETIEITLTDVTGADVSIGAPSQHTYTIVDPRPYVQFDSETGGGSENLTAAKVNVNLSWPSDETVTVDYDALGGTAANGSDYVLPPGTLIFEPGQTNAERSMPRVS
jgi:hypothetical protein